MEFGIFDLITAKVFLGRKRISSWMSGARLSDHLICLIRVVEIWQKWASSGWLMIAPFLYP
jgi:hypothetical protein